MSLLRILLGYTLLQSSKSDKAWFFWGIWSITMYHQVGIWILWSTVPGRWRWSVQQQLGRDSSCDPMMPSLEHPVMVCRSPKKHWKILIDFPKFDRDLSKMSWTQLNYAELLDLLIWFIYDIYIYIESGRILCWYPQPEIGCEIGGWLCGCRCRCCPKALAGNVGTRLSAYWKRMWPGLEKHSGLKFIIFPLFRQEDLVELLFIPSEGNNWGWANVLLIRLLGPNGWDGPTTKPLWLDCRCHTFADIFW